ncbi:MAG: efflux RND transporter periplasmic adaptor subunit [Desulfuromonadales bacterium]|nr:efflux RND transporter periplasmic adaptor subunit [Desulfuromonadales bacterium]
MKKVLITRNDQSGFFRRGLARSVLLVSLILGCCLSSAMAQEVVGVSGITEPVHDVILSLPTMGTVSRVFYNEGDHVKKGAVIINLDRQLESLEVERRKLIWQSKAELNSAIARVATMGSQLNSSRELYKSTGSISLEELEQQQLEYELAVAEKERLENNEERERIEYKIAVEQLNKRSLRAPFSGVITELLVDIGETSELDVPLVHLVDTSRGLFVCTVEEQVGRTLKRGPSVDLEILAGAAPVKIKGQITYVDPVVDPASGLQRVKVIFQNKDGKIRPGVAGTMFVVGSSSSTGQ